MTTALFLIKITLIVRVVATPLFPALRKQRQVVLYEFEDSLVYIAGSRTARLHSKTLTGGKIFDDAFILFSVPGIKPRFPQMLGKCSRTKLHPTLF